jgi:hypothetical protein
VRSIRISIFLGILTIVAVALPAAPAQAVTTAGLWHMDETSGTTAVDSSGNRNNGSNTNITYVTPGFNGSGGAYSYNGTTSKVIVPNAASLNPGTQNVSITIHVKFTVVPPPSVGDYDLVRKGTSNYYKVEITDTGKTRCQFHGTTNGAGVVFGPNLADGAWHTIVCTKTATSITGVVDGTFTKTKNITIGSITNSVALSLGCKSSGNDDLYRGLMDEVSITVG